MNNNNIEEALMRSSMILRKKVEEREQLEEALEKVNLAFKRYKNSLLNKEDDK